jgi:hypothetical protein
MTIKKRYVARIWPNGFNGSLPILSEPVESIADMATEVYRIYREQNIITFKGRWQWKHPEKVLPMSVYTDVMRDTFRKISYEHDKQQKQIKRNFPLDKDLI